MRRNLLTIITLCLLMVSGLCAAAARPAYDSAQRLSQLVNENNAVFAFSYDAAGNLTEETRPGGQKVRLERDANGWPVAVTHHPGVGDEEQAGLLAEGQRPA
jgi:YD repeat-containing protein